MSDQKQPRSPWPFPAGSEVKVRRSSDSEEASELQSYLLNHHADQRPKDGAGLFGWALAALRSLRRQVAYKQDQE